MESKKSYPLILLFTSASTLVCCALPALFVTLGFGASLATLISAVPQLIWFSEHKALVFGFSALALAWGGYMQWRAQFEPCPIDPQLRDACTRTRRFSLFFYIFSLIIYLVGVFFAFVINWL